MAIRKHIVQAVISLVVLLPVFAQAQNLVLNHSFESYNYCPIGFNNKELQLIKNWEQPTYGTVDYYNVCSEKMGVPSNIFGAQDALAGSGYVGLITFAPSERNYREYIQGKLLYPLKAGQQYCVKFYVSLADDATYVNDGMGVLFSREEVKNASRKILEATPQIMNPTGHVLRNDSAWIELSGAFTAEGGEEYITVGNFTPDVNLAVERRKLKIPSDEVVWEYSYLFLDDISVAAINDTSECSCSINDIAEHINDPEYIFKYAVLRQVELKSVHFDFDKYHLKKKAINTLNNTVEIMKEHDNYYVEVIGHTDIIGPDDYNVDLSKERAQAVLNYLVKKGVPKERLQINFFGSTKPITSNETDRGRAQNRRVDFVILEK